MGRAILVRSHCLTQILLGAQVSRRGKGAKAGQGHTEITGWSWEPLSTQTKHPTEDLATAL